MFAFVLAVVVSAQHESVVLRRAGDLEGAVAAADDSVAATLAVADLLAERGARSVAEARLIEATRTNHPDAWRLLGLLRGDRGAHREAAEALRVAVALNPTDLGAVHGLERALVELDRPSLGLVTFASDRESCGLRRLERSAEGFGIEVLSATPWSNGLKLDLLRQYASTRETDVLLVVDGYDVVMAAPPERARRRLTDALLPGEVIASADQTFYFRGPDEACYGRIYPEPPAGPYRFLNSGALLGRGADLANLTAFALDTATTNWDGVSDQTLLHRIYVEQQFHHRNSRPCAGFGMRLPEDLPKIRLDTRQDLFGNTGGRAFLGDFDVVAGRLHNNLTDTFPLLLHCPGERRFRAEFDRLKALGWDVDIIPCQDHREA